MSQNEIGMGVLGDIVRRSASTLMRAEERASLIIYNKIHNDKSRGSKNIFREEQLCLLGKIAEQAEDYFNEYSLKRDVGLTEIEVPEIFLVSYKKWLVWQQQKRCESAFAKKMRTKYEEEKAELEKIRQSNPKEYDKAERKLKKKYGPWICEAKECCEGCVRVKRTSLGWFDPERYEICICLDKIMDIYPIEKVDAISAKVLFHELGHALMYNSKHLHYETLFEHWAEEALANKISLRYLFVASKLLGMPELFIHAKEMVEKQDEEYRLGLWAFENNALDWQTLRDNKTNIDEETGDLWVDAVCEDEKVFLDIQKLFYGTFIVGSRPSVSVAPTTTERFYFEDESRIEKTRVYFSTCKIKTDPGFQHCYPDSTRIEIELTFKDKVGNVLCSGPASFYAGTQNLFIKGQLLKDYRNHYGLVKGIRFAFRELKPADGTHNAEWVASEI